MNKAIIDIHNQLLAQDGIQSLLRHLIFSHEPHDKTHLETMLMHSTRTSALLSTLQQQFIKNAAHEPTGTEL